MTHERPRPEFSDSRTLRKSSPRSHRYEGPVAADMRHGDDGKMFYAAGDTYQGAWFEDGREGMGTMWCAWFSTPRERGERFGGGGGLSKFVFFVLCRNGLAVGVLGTKLAAN